MCIDRDGQADEGKETLVTPNMARAGADELRSRVYGESLEQIVTEVFYVMSGVAQVERREASLSSRE